MKCPCCNHKVSVMSIPEDDRYICSQCGNETRLARCLVSLNDFMFWYVSKNGIESLQDSRKLIAYAKDLLPKKKSEIVALSDALNGGVVQTLMNGNAIRFNKDQQLLDRVISLLQNEQFMTQEEATTVAGYFSSALGWSFDQDACEDAFIELLPTKTVDELIESARDYAFGYDKTRDYTKVKQCLEAAAQKGSTYAMRALAKALSESLIKDSHSVEYWYSMAIEHGSILAYGELFTYYLTAKQYSHIEGLMQRIADQNVFYSIAAAAQRELWFEEHILDIVEYNNWLLSDADRKRRLFEEYTSVIDMFTQGSISDADRFTKCYCHHVLGLFIGLNDASDIDQSKVEQSVSLWNQIIKQGLENDLPLVLASYPVLMWLDQSCAPAAKDKVIAYLKGLPGELSQWSEYFIAACVEKKALEYEYTSTSMRLMNGNEVDAYQDQLVLPLAQAGNEWAHSHYIKNSIENYSMAFEGVRNIVLQFPYALDKLIKCIPSLIDNKEYEKALKIYSTLTFEEQAVNCHLPEILRIYCYGVGGDDRFEKALDLLDYRFNSDLSNNDMVSGFSDRSVVNALEFVLRMNNQSIRTAQYSDGVSRLKKVLRLRGRINEVFEQHYLQNREISDRRTEDASRFMGAPVIDLPLGTVAFYLMNVYCFGLGVKQSLEKAKEYYDYAKKTGVTINWDKQRGADELSFAEGVILARFDNARYQQIRNMHGAWYYAAEGVAAYLNKDFQNAYNCFMRALSSGGISGVKDNPEEQFFNYYFAMLLSECQLDGKFDFDRARDYLYKSCLAGNIFAIPQYVYRLFMDSVTIEPEALKQWFGYVSVMAKAGCSDAKLAVYIGIHNNIVNERNNYPCKEKWYDYLKEAYEDGCSQAAGIVNYHMNRAYGYLHGVNGIVKNPGMAFEEYYKAAYCGHISGQLNVGILYWRGLGVPADRTKAEKWMITAVENGNYQGISALLQFYCEESMEYRIPAAFAIVEHWQEDASKIQKSYRLLNCGFSFKDQLCAIAQGATQFLKANQMKDQAAALLKKQADLLCGCQPCEPAMGEPAANYAVYLYNNVGLKEACEYAMKAQQAGFENDTTKSIINYVRIQQEIQSEQRIISDSRKELGTLGFFAGRRKGELNAQIKKSEERIQNLERTLKNTIITASYT